MTDSKADVRERLRQWRSAAVAERCHQRDQAEVESRESFARALELIDLAPALREPDPVRDRGVEQVRAMWAKLRRAYGLVELEKG